MKIKKSYDAEFVRLGTRKYVQGSTITSSLIDAANHWGLSPIDRIVANFHSLLFVHGTYDLFGDAESLKIMGRDYVAVFHVYSGEVVHYIGLKGRGTSVDVSLPYDEQSLTATSELCEKTRSISMLLTSPDLLMNIIIAMNKKLLLTVFPVEGYARWILAKYDLRIGKFKIDGQMNVTVKVSGSVGITSVKSIIIVGTESVGYVYFTREMV